MTFSKSYEGMRQRQEDLRFNFIISELDLAFTFYQMAASASGTGKVNCNEEHARHARHSARTALKNATFSPEQHHEVALRMDRLKDLSENADIA
jgi:hypothetical protein